MISDVSAAAAESIHSAGDFPNNHCWSLVVKSDTHLKPADL